MKLGIVGSRSYTNKERIKRVVEYYLNKFGRDLIIVSGGCPKGADFLAKEIALETGIAYQEFPPIHFEHNIHCVCSKDEYNKSYHVSNFFTRNTQIAEYSEHLIAFIVRGVEARGTMDTVRKARKLDRQVIVYEDD